MAINDDWRIHTFELGIDCPELIPVRDNARPDRAVKWFYVWDGKHQNDFTEQAIPAQRSHGDALALDIDVVVKQREQAL